MQWYKGNPTTLFDNWEFGDNPLWADYQVLGPSFAAASVLLGIEDVLPVILGARGCAVHIRFTKIAWGGDFNLSSRPLPFIEVSRNDVINGRYRVAPDQLDNLRSMAQEMNYKMIAIMSNDDVLLSCADLEPLRHQVEDATGITTDVLEVSPLAGRNQWVGYDRALGLLYRNALAEPPPQKKDGINMVGWKWPSRERKHDIGACLALLEALDIRVNHVIPGGSSLAAVRDSLASRANLLWCPSYIGETLEMLEKEHGLPLAGYTSPYGFEGTTTWLSELGRALGCQQELVAHALRLRTSYENELEPLRASLKGVRGFVSGGPGRLPGLLSIMADLEINVVAAALYWPHPSSKKTFPPILDQLPNPPATMLVAPSLYDLEEIAAHEKIDFWMGGYQEQHACKRHGIPFIPTTVYTKSHQCYEGVVTVAQKILKALSGFDFVANVFQSVEE